MTEKEGLTTKRLNENLTDTVHKALCPKCGKRHTKKHRHMIEA